MIDPARLFEYLRSKGISFFTGVPDSLLESFLSVVQNELTGNDHIITANEGLAVGLASGYHLATGKCGLVYLQNSGLGNLVNPLTSLADPEVFSIPLVLMIGWRGMPGIMDEPQHRKMGEITLRLLEAMDIPHYILSEVESKSFDQVDKACQKAIAESKPVALLVPPGIFHKLPNEKPGENKSLVREAVIAQIIAAMEGTEVVVCTTGKIGREFYEQNLLAGKKIRKYFLNVGAMGHANHIALGIKLALKGKVFMLDGDGSILMHMGSLPTITHYAPDHFIHIILNNGMHESVGGQPTEGLSADLCRIAEGCGYEKTLLITDQRGLVEWLREMNSEQSQFVEIRINGSSRSDLGRPVVNPGDWKKNLMEELRKAR